MRRRRLFARSGRPADTTPMLGAWAQPSRRTIADLDRLVPFRRIRSRKTYHRSLPPGIERCGIHVRFPRRDHGGASSRIGGANEDRSEADDNGVRRDGNDYGGRRHRAGQDGVSRHADRAVPSQRKRRRPPCRGKRERVDRFEQPGCPRSIRSRIRGGEAADCRGGRPRAPISAEPPCHQLCRGHATRSAAGVDRPACSAEPGNSASVRRRSPGRDRDPPA